MQKKYWKEMLEEIFKGITFTINEGREEKVEVTQECIPSPHFVNTKFDTIQAGIVKI